MRDNETELLVDGGFTNYALESISNNDYLALKATDTQVIRGFLLFGQQRLTDIKYGRQKPMLLILV